MPDYFFHEEFLPDIQSKTLLDDVSSHPTCYQRPTSLFSSAGSKPHFRQGLHSKSLAAEPSALGHANWLAALHVAGGLELDDL